MLGILDRLLGRPGVETRKIWLDSPAPGTALAASEAFVGWTITPDPTETIAATVNGRAARIHAIPRPDLEADRPGQNGAGFMFFFEAEPGVADYQVELRIGSLVRTLPYQLAPRALDVAAEVAPIRASHRTFLETAVACPMCRAPVALREAEGKQWNCSACGTDLDLREGLDMIPEYFEGKRDIRFAGAIGVHGYDSATTAIVDRVAEAGGMVLDCGAGWRARMHPNVITTEILRYPSTDVVAVGQHLPFRDNSFDAVLSLHVLEHVKNPFVCAQELVRVLKPGGTLYAVTPYVVGVHGYPFHFFNPTPSGLRALFDGLIKDTDITVPPGGHPFLALQELLALYEHHFTPDGRAAFRATTIGELLDRSQDELTEGALAASFGPHGKDVLAGNYAIRGIKV